jgi:murein DD-endopeptidase MepM/ murein hydrolase activator NlpD
MQRAIDNGHLGDWLLKSGSQVVRGQVLAKSGKSGNKNTYLGRSTPQLHWDIAAYGENLYLNPFATLSDDIYSKNCKIMESKNLWTVYNTMVFP